MPLHPVVWTLLLSTEWWIIWSTVNLQSNNDDVDYYRCVCSRFSRLFDFFFLDLPEEFRHPCNTLANSKCLIDPTVIYLLKPKQIFALFFRWDFPNGWPPLQHMLVVGLENTGDPRAKALAFNLAQKWLINNYDAYQQSMPNAMFEKVRPKR